MRILIDTNVLVSAALQGGTPTRAILLVISHPDFSWIMSEEIREEYLRKLSSPKLKLSESTIEKWRLILQKNTVLLRISLIAQSAPIRDPGDAMWLRCAQVAAVDILVTGDKDFDPLRGATSLQIMTPAEFLQAFG